MKQINLRQAEQQISNEIEELEDDAIICDVVGLTTLGKSRLRFFVSLILLKHNFQKYVDDAVDIILELAFNAIKADYAHILTITNLKMLSIDYKDKIASNTYLNDMQIMTDYVLLLQDKDTKEEVKELLRLEGMLFGELDNDSYKPDKKYDRLHFFRDASHKPVVIKLLVEKTSEHLTFTLTNYAPLTIGSKARIEAKRLIFREYYKRNCVERFFLEQLDTLESAGFGIPLIDLRLLNLGLEPAEHFIVSSSLGTTSSKLILPVS